jgi:hypothetical protein
MRQPIFNSIIDLTIREMARLDAAATTVEQQPRVQQPRVQQPREQQPQEQSPLEQQPTEAATVAQPWEQAANGSKATVAQPWEQAMVAILLLQLQYSNEILKLFIYSL